MSPPIVFFLFCILLSHSRQNKNGNVHIAFFYFSIYFFLTNSFSVCIIVNLLNIQLHSCSCKEYFDYLKNNWKKIFKLYLFIKKKIMQQSSIERREGNYFLTFLFKITLFSVTYQLRHLRNPDDT